MKSIDNNAPVKCHKTITINAKREIVWKLITDINEWPSWQTDISKSAFSGELKPETPFRWKSGGATIQSILHTVVPFHQFGWTGSTFGIRAIHNWQLEELNNQTILKVEESMNGLLARIFRKFFNKTLERGMVKWLALLKLESER